MDRSVSGGLVGSGSAVRAALRVVRVAGALALIALAALATPEPRAAASGPSMVQTERAGPALAEGSPAAGSQAGASGGGDADAGGTVAGGAIYAPNLAVLTIEGPITAVTSMSMSRRIERAVAAGADALVIDIDTPGGEVGAVLEICTELKRAPVPTIAWINPTAYSGGAIIALACDRIIASAGATMGDAAPIQMSPLGLDNLGRTERAKITSPLIAEVVDSARQHGYDEVLVQSFVMIGVETWLVEHTPTGRRYLLTEREYRDLFGEAPPRGQPAVASGAGGDVDPGESPARDLPVPEIGPAPGEQSEQGERDGGGPPEPAEADGDIFQPDDLPEEVTRTIESDSTRPLFSREDPREYRLLRYATDGETIPTLKGGQLRSFGFVRTGETINTDEELARFLGAQNIKRLDQSWSESFVAFMTQGVSGLVVRGLLIVVFLLAMFVELVAPGFGGGGFVALVALAGLLVPPMMIGAASWWAVAAIGGGVALLLLEVLVIPGTGLPGVAGLILLFSGLVGTVAGAGQLFPGQGGGDGMLVWSITTVLLALFAAGVGMYFISRYTHSIPVLKSMVLTDAQPGAAESGRPSMLGSMAAPVGTPVSDSGVARGARGVTVTPLRPSGTAEFEGALVDVVSEVGFVEAGAAVTAVSVAGNRVGVEPTRDAGPPAGPVGGGAGASGDGAGADESRAHEGGDDGSDGARPGGGEERSG